MSGAGRWIAAVALLALSGSCVSTDEQGPGLRAARSPLGQGASDSSACGAVAFEGCCLGDTLYYCNSGQVLSVDCSQNPSCGWDSVASYYNCGTGGQPDPGGAHPKVCDFGDAGPPVASNSCGGFTWQGCCHGEMLHFCYNGLQHEIDCTAIPFCGWNANGGFYECGTTGQADPSGTYPKACALDAAVPDLGPPKPCGKVTEQGCCDGETLMACVNGNLFVGDCTGMPFCGWLGGAMGGSYNCGTSGKADPSGTHPKACAALLDAAVPSVIPCGDVTWQGCCHGELLYRCYNGLQVVDCRRFPSCGWDVTDSMYNCGVDGAADPTGLFPKACDFGDAGPPAIDDTCGSIPWQGCCDGQTVYYCDGGILRTRDCGMVSLCGWTTSGAYSYYDCDTDGKADPSGHFPKACPHDAGVLDASAACGPVTHQGCCEGDTLYWCASGTLNSIDCSKSPSCGWQAAAGYYDCSTDGTGDPTGKHSMACGFDGGAPLGQQRDAPPPSDRSFHDSRSTGDPGDSGCGCALPAAARSPGGVTLLLLLLLVVTPHRRAS